MGGICTRISPESILINVRETGKDAIVRRLVAALARINAVSDPDLLQKEVMEREELASTCVGLGCAVPHAHSATVESTMIAAASLNPPVDLDAFDGEPVSLVFLIAGPEGSAGLHLRILSKLARLLHDQEFREELRNADDPGTFFDVLCRKDG